MRARRDFLRAAAMCSPLLWYATRAAAQTESTTAATPLRILILGGTGAIGPYHVRAAVARGHRVAVFSRGQRSVELPATVERLVGDRNGNLRAIGNRDWDAVIDIATFGPGWVRALGEALRDRIRHYTFISTVSVYDKPEANGITHEASPVVAYTGSADPYASVEHVGDHYGALKVLAEREAEKQFPGKTLVLRPGYIGGPGDTRALTYWAVRAQKGGEMLAAGDPLTPVQYIDVRDMAAWAIRLAEQRVTGTYNTVGPATPLTFGQLVEIARETLSPQARATWVPVSWLSARGESQLWGTVLFWQQGVGNIMRMSNELALKNGLTTRPVSATLADVLRWYEQQPAEQRNSLTTGFRRKDDGSGWTSATMPWTDYLQREKQTLAAWQASRAAAG